MPLQSIEDLVRTHVRGPGTGGWASGGPAGAGDGAPACARHPERPTLGLCRKCGAELCGRCAALAGGASLCPGCRSTFARAASGLWSVARTPGGTVVFTIVALSAVYVAVTGGRSGAFATSGGTVDAKTGAKPDVRTVERRNWLYLVKAGRSRHYAKHLAKRGQPELARERRSLATAAMEEVLRGAEELGYDRPAGAPGRRYSPLARAAREDMARILVALAVCYIEEDGEEDRAERALSALERAMGLAPKPRTAGVARYRAGRLLEEKLDRPREAISMYKVAQSERAKQSDFIGSLADDAGRPLKVRLSRVALREFMGTFDPAEAQARVIACYRKLGEKEKAKKEADLLLERYTYSEQAAEISKARGEPERSWERSFRSVPEKEGEGDGRPTETLTITTLEE